MNNKSSSSIIKSFAIYGLFGTNDVRITFDENIKIIIGENAEMLNLATKLYIFTHGNPANALFHQEKLIRLNQFI